MAENKGILPSSTFNTLGNNSNKWEAVYAKKYYDAEGKELLNTPTGMTIPTGMIIPFAGNASRVPVGYLLCDGSAISRTNYAKLFSVIGTIYGEGDGSTTFALPNLIDRVVQGAATAGTYKAAGLPNITGQAGGATCEGFNAGAANSALYAIKVLTTGRAAGGGGGIVDILLNASRSNSIYGNSTTVQPPALTMLPIIKY